MLASIVVLLSFESKQNYILFLRAADFHIVRIILLRLKPINQSKEIILVSFINRGVISLKKDMLSANFIIDGITTVIPYLEKRYIIRIVIANLIFFLLISIITHRWGLFFGSVIASIVVGIIWLVFGLMRGFLRFWR